MCSAYVSKVNVYKCVIYQQCIEGGVQIPSDVVYRH